MNYEPLQLPFKIQEFDEDMVVALDRNFSAIERALAKIQVYENLTGIPTNIDVWEHTSLREFIARYGEKKVFQQESPPTIGLGELEAREFDLWWRMEGGVPVWRQVRKMEAGLQWVIVANRTTHPAEYDIITTVGLDAAVITTGLLNAARIHIGSASTFDPDYDPSEHDNTQTIIDGGLITTGTIQLRDGVGVTKAGTTATGTGDSQIRLWAGETYLNRASAPFRVTQGGALISTSGFIGGWTIDGTTGLKLGTGANTRGIATGNIAFYAGDASPAHAPFRVGMDGSLVATMGNLRGLILGSPTTDGLWLSDTHLGYYSGGLWRTFMDNTGKFYLGGTSGSLQWNGSTLTITGHGTFTGTITANAGRIGGAGGWIITTGRIYSDDIELKVGAGTSGYIRNINNRWILYNDGSGSLGQGNISWTATGVVTFAGGYLGGINRVTVDGSGLNVGTWGSIRGGASSYGVGTGFWMGYSGGAYQFRIGNPAGSRVSWDGNFLTVQGHIVASSGSFTGAVYASSGYFYGAVYASSGSFTGAVYASSGYFYGAVYASSGTFAGSLSAATGTFAGSLSATSGTFTTLTAGGSDYIQLSQWGMLGMESGIQRIYITKNSIQLYNGAHTIYSSSSYLYFVSGGSILMRGGGTAQLWVSNSNFCNVTGNLNVSGALTKGSGTFFIDHPLDPKTKNLVHGFVEAPRYDLIYRGRLQLVKGRGKVNIDEASNMSPGTFEVLTQNAEVVSLCNQTGFSRLKPSSIKSGRFTIECEEDVNDEVVWVVMAERADDYVMKEDPTIFTDELGRLVPEHLKGGESDVSSSPEIAPRPSEPSDIS